MNNSQVLVVEDEAKIANVLVKYLQDSGFRTQVVGDGDKAISAIMANEPNFVILDLQLPGKDGISVCREVRSFSNVPILMLTARVDEIDRLLGLEVGADDYVCKPFSPLEVISRVKTILRRSNGQAHDVETISYRSIRLSVRKFKCLVKGEPIELTPVEFKILRALISSPGDVFSREKLAAMSYDDHRVVSGRTVDSHVRNLRRKLGEHQDDEVIHAVYGIGYKLE